MLSTGGINHMSYRIKRGKKGGISSKQNWREFYGHEAYDKYVADLKNSIHQKPAPTPTPKYIINPKDDPEEWEYRQWLESHQEGDEYY